jgi:hypothetical protein
MNRRERRTAKKHGTTIIDFGRLVTPDDALPVDCYICATPHKASGVARIQERQSITYVPLCDQCFTDSGDAVVRKYMNAPDLKIHEGGEATTAQLSALADKQDATEHCR